MYPVARRMRRSPEVTGEQRSIAATPAPVTQAGMADDLRALGVRPGSVLLVHTAMSALGWVCGGPQAVVGALLDALGPEGTLMAYASWEEHAYDADLPAFDPATAPAARDHGRIPERVRTWPGAHRSFHPEASVVAVGARAGELTRDHPQEDGYGAASPFARLCEAGGEVLMLGAPLETITLLHHAEAIARVPGKRTATFTVARRTYTDIDTTRGAVEYERLGLDDDEFAVIGREALEAGIGVRGTVGEAPCALYPARELVAFGVAWIEARFS
jgi:aminoglycoside 3-N-acetyltransferase